MATRALGIFVGGTQRVDPTTRAPVFSLDVADLDAGQEGETLRRIPLGFLAHGLTVDPKRPHLAVVTEKKGPGAALVDLAEGRALGLLKAREGRAFYGHGSYSADGDVVFVVETELASKRGLLSVRDAKTFAILEEFPTYGASPHDCVLEGDHLVITNGGGTRDSNEAPCVTFVEVKSRKLLDKIDIPVDFLNAGHLAVDGADLAVTSAPREGLPERESLGGVSLRSAGRACETMRTPNDVTSRMLGESLSVCFFDREEESARTRIAAVTNPWGNLLTFWDVHRATLVRAMDLELPRGVALAKDGSRLVVSHGARAGLLTIDTRTLEPKDGAEALGTSRFSGSHLYRWAAGELA